MTGNIIREIARAARLRDLKAVEAALNRFEGDYAEEVRHGRALAEKPKDPPPPPLEVDSLTILAADAIASFTKSPPKTEWERRVFENAKSVAHDAN